MVCVFQRVHRSAGGWEAQLQVRSSISGVGLSLGAISALVACSKTVWIPITSVTVMPTMINGTELYYLKMFPLKVFNSNSSLS